MDLHTYAGKCTEKYWKFCEELSKEDIIYLAQILKKKVGRKAFETFYQDNYDYLDYYMTLTPQQRKRKKHMPSDRTDYVFLIFAAIQYCYHAANLLRELHNQFFGEETSYTGVLLQSHRVYREMKAKFSQPYYWAFENICPSPFEY